MIHNMHLTYGNLRRSTITNVWDVILKKDHVRIKDLITLAIWVLFAKCSKYFIGISKRCMNTSGACFVTKLMNAMHLMFVPFWDNTQV